MLEVQGGAGVTIKTRQAVHAKYNGHCAYCGREIDIKEMQVDHFRSKREMQDAPDCNDINNLMPSCRRCNHYKRAGGIEYYRVMLLDMRRKLLDTYLGKVAVDYGMVEWQGWDGVFYFEKEANP